MVDASSYAKKRLFGNCSLLLNSLFMHLDSISSGNYLIIYDSFLQLTDVGFVKIVHGRIYKLWDTIHYLASEIVSVFK